MSTTANRVAASETLASQIKSRLGICFAITVSAGGEINNTSNKLHDSVPWIELKRTVIQLAPKRDRFELLSETGKSLGEITNGSVGQIFQDLLRQLSDEEIQRYNQDSQTDIQHLSLWSF